VTLHSTAIDGLHRLTDLADQAVVLPVIIAVLLLLLGVGERRAALLWVVAVGVSLGGVLLAKIGFIACGRLVPALNMESPSGHTAASAAVYGGILVLAMQSRLSAGRSQLILGALLLALVFAIGVSRVLLHAHTVPEAALGGLIGLLAPAILILPRPLFIGSVLGERRWVLALPLLAGLAFYGMSLGVEREIHVVAGLFASHFAVCV
jgi:hypothetical protein